MQEKIIITGGPGTGKSTVLNELQKQNFLCMHEISRDITLQARKTGIEQLFLKDPVLFSKLLLEGREIQIIWVFHMMIYLSIPVKQIGIPKFLLCRPGKKYI